MAVNPGYASIPRIGVGTVTTGDASRTAPAQATRAQVFAAGANGSRIERIAYEAIGATVGSVLRLFLMEGAPGAAVSSITFAGTTATVTTATPHGLKTGDLVTVWGAAPLQYGVKQTAVTVTSGTIYTYAMATAPATNAVAVGQYSTTPAVPTMTLWQELPVAALAPSNSVMAFTGTLEAVTTPQLMPQLLPPGWSLVASVNDTQTGAGINVIANGGDF